MGKKRRLDNITEMPKEYVQTCIDEWMGGQVKDSIWVSKDHKKWDMALWQCWKTYARETQPKIKKTLQFWWSLFIIAFGLVFGYVGGRTVGAVIGLVISLLAAGAFVLLTEAGNLIRREEDAALIEKNEAIFNEDRKAYKQYLDKEEEIW